MTKTKLISMIGAATLLLGFGLNLQYALDDYGFTKNSLSGFMLVQAANTSSSNSDKNTGKASNTEVTCTITTTVSVNTSNNSSNTYGFDGGFSGGLPWFSANVSANTSNTSGTGQLLIVTKTTTSTFKAKKVLCYPGKEECTPFDPCQ